MLLAVHKESGIPLFEEVESVMDLPHTISYAIMYRAKINSFNELPKDKRPPRYMWDRSSELGEFLDHVWDSPDTKKTDSSYYEYKFEDVE